jgi:hypothetical protein
MNKINKGYTLTVKSWENDADNPQTKSKTVATIEEAKVWWDMMQLCKSKNNQPKGVVMLGNSYDGFTSKQKEVAIDFIKEHHKILLPDDDIESNEDNLADWFCDLAGELLGHGEDYACRVMESCVVTYSPVDVIPEIIKF